MGESLPSMIQRLEAGNPSPPSAGFLGADLNLDEARLVLLQAPWEVTTSYGGGASQGPAAIIQASHQMDLEDRAFGQPYRAGIAVADVDPDMVNLNATLKPLAQQVITALEQGECAKEALDQVNSGSERFNNWLQSSAASCLQQGQLVGVVGGDHSSPLGLMMALANHHASFGVLHLDAHHDLRCAYEGFRYSHASIMYNLLQSAPQAERLVQVAIRDYSREEAEYCQQQGDRVHCHYATDLFRQKAFGKSFAELADAILAPLPELVYVSFDIDALDPSCCPNTGTPVPGGLSFDEACYLLEALAKSGRKIIGFDLSEVAPGANGDEWDANVGARMLYKLCGALLYSQGLIYQAGQ